MKKVGYRKCRKCKIEKPYGKFGRYPDVKRTMHVNCEDCYVVDEKKADKPDKEKPFYLLHPDIIYM